MLKIKKIEIEDLNEEIVGKNITDSNKTEIYKVIKRYDGELSKEVLVEDNLAIDDYMLLNDYYILVEV